MLDTHVAIWAITRNPLLPTRMVNMIEDLENRVFVSVVTLWEIAIKRRLARRGIGQMPISATDGLSYFRKAGYEILDVSAEHAVGVENLPHLHRDPFDRLLVAQALREPLRLLTHDVVVADYSDTVILF